MEFLAEKAGHWAVVRLVYPLGTMYELTYLLPADRPSAEWAVYHLTGVTLPSAPIGREHTALLGNRGEQTDSYWVWAD